MEDIRSKNDNVLNTCKKDLYNQKLRSSTMGFNCVLFSNFSLTCSTSQWQLRFFTFIFPVGYMVKIEFPGELGFLLHISEFVGLL